VFKHLLEDSDKQPAEPQGLITTSQRDIKDGQAGAGKAAVWSWLSSA